MDGVTTDRIEKVSVDSLIGPLNDIEKKFAPQWLYIAGDKRIIKHPSRVSIIGTRTPSQTGIENAQKLANFLVKNDVVIISGLAKGIDKIGHETTIKAGGKTIAVLGTPLNKCYPNENLQLQKEIIRNHLAISQFPIGHPTQKKNFPLRNRTMAV
jgi:DNA processing protein